MSRRARTPYPDVSLADWMFVAGSSLIFRAFFGVPTSMRSPDGKPVNGVRGFMDRLATLIAEYRPGRLAVASDEEWRPAWRGLVFPPPQVPQRGGAPPPPLAPPHPVNPHAVGRARG